MFDSKNSINLILVITSAVILVNIILMMFVLYLYQKKKIINFKNKFFHKSSYQNNLFESHIKLQEETFKKISEEIHDNIGLTLTLVKLNLNTLDKSNFLNVIEVTEQSDELLTHAINDLRLISRTMNPEAVKNVGLYNAIEEEVEKVNKVKTTKVILKSTGTPFFLEPKKELLIFRIIQESLNNILKHAQASKAWIILNYKENWIYLVIKDNGIGYDKNKKIFNNSLGTINIKARCQLLNGTLETKSNSRGTTLTISIPYQISSNEQSYSND